MNKDKTISLRLPKERYESLSKEAYNEGYSSVSDYIRDCLSKKKKSVKSMTRKTVSLVISLQDDLNSLFSYVNDNPDSCNAEVKTQITSLIEKENKIWQT